MADGTTQPAGLSYERRLDADGRWALSEGSRYFDGTSEVHATLERICKRLNELQIPYAIAGGMALFKHGYRRFTEDIDILVSRENLKQIHGQLSGLGYLPLFEGSKNLRDTRSGVRIEFLLTGDYPGDGKQKPVAFPDPAEVAELKDNVRVLNLPTIVELKLASGMTGAGRIKDLADVQELIKLFSLSEDFGDRLKPYVQSKYHELWQATTSSGRRYIRLWPNKSLLEEIHSIDELIELLPDDTRLLKQMRDDGVTLDPSVHASEEYVGLVTTDPEVAKKYDMHEQSEFWSDGGT